ncbi:MAG: aminoacyl-tRNA hydrolase, partial [Dietzia sp.]|nr:aminoacyl-tRNA hydrolase [Dietzia sp.]
ARSSSVPERLRERMLARLGNRLIGGVLVVTASEHRAQLQNRMAARERMARVLRAAAAAPPPVRRPTKPTRGSKERRLADKKRRGRSKMGRRGVWDRD